MFVNVVYFHEDVDGFCGESYTYETALALKIGDRVIAPTAKNPEQRAVVVMVCVPEPEFPCREITAYYTPETEGGADG